MQDYCLCIRADQLASDASRALVRTLQGPKLRKMLVVRRDTIRKTWARCAYDGERTNY